MPLSLLQRLHETDRAIYLRLAAGPAGTILDRAWSLVTHLGGARASTMAIVLPLAIGGVLGDTTAGTKLVHAALTVAAVLLLSQLVVHVIKRAICRARPEPAHEGCLLVPAPDRFSFPSGHSAAATAVAVGYTAAYPALAAPLLAVATLVCVSRVRLGVHYPGDVLVGQLIAVSTAALVLGVTIG